MRGPSALSAMAIGIPVATWTVITLVTWELPEIPHQILDWHVIAGAATTAALSCLTRAFGYASAGGAAMGFVLTMPFLLRFGLCGLVFPAAMVILTKSAAHIDLLLHRLDTSHLSGPGKARSASQALANLGSASTMCLLAWLYPRLWMFGVAAVSCLASATADTCASEVGQLTRGRTIDILSLKPCKPGTDGGVSLLGSLSGILTSAAVGAVWVATHAESTWLAWPTPSAVEQAVCITIAGIVGLTADSVIGATIERRGLVDNDGTNLISSWLAGWVCLILCESLQRMRS